MTYKIVVQESAKKDARDYARFIREKSHTPEPASRWLNGLQRVIEAVTMQPARFELIPERDEFDIELRHMLYHSHRVIYFINEGSRTVHILRIYHGARQPLAAGDVSL